MVTEPTSMPRAADLPERCCPVGGCRYKPDSVRRFVKAIRALRSARLDLTSNAGSVINPRRGYDAQRGGGIPERYDEAKSALIVADILRAMRSAHDGITLTELCQALCPFSDEEPTS